MAGVEPARREPLPPQDSVSTSSTTSAFQAGNLSGYKFCWEVQGESGFPLEFPRKATKLKGVEGVVAEWLGRGLQNLVQRFDPARHLQSCQFLKIPQNRTNSLPPKGGWRLVGNVVEDGVHPRKFEQVDGERIQQIPVEASELRSHHVFGNHGA